MRNRSIIWVISAVILLVIGIVFFTRSSPPRYTLVEIKGLAGAPFEAHAINNRGQIVGVSIMVKRGKYYNPIGRAVLWNEGISRNLGVPDLQEYCTLDINDRGQVIGHYSDPKGKHERRSFFYERGKSIGLDHWRLLALDINETGDILGDVLGNGYHGNSAILRNGKLRHIGSTNNHVSVMNDNGQIATAFESSHLASIWNNGKVRTLGELDVKCDYYYPSSINNRGQVVGVAISEPQWTQPGMIQEFIDRLLHRFPDPQESRYTFISENGKMRQLDVEDVLDVKINNRGEIAGTRRVGEDVTQSFIMLEGKPRNLNDLIDRKSGYTIKSVSDINDKGEIIGQATHDGEECAVLLRPINR